MDRFEYEGPISLRDIMHPGSKYLMLDGDSMFESAVRKYLEDSVGGDIEYEVLGHIRDGGAIRRASLGRVRITVERVDE